MNDSEKGEAAPGESGPLSDASLLPNGQKVIAPSIISKRLERGTVESVRYFYLIDLERTAPVGQAITWWAPFDTGYTKNLVYAGLYSEHQIRCNPGFYDNDEVRPVLMWDVYKYATGFVSPPTSELTLHPVHPIESNEWAEVWVVNTLLHLDALLSISGISGTGRKALSGQGGAAPLAHVTGKEEQPN